MDGQTVGLSREIEMIPRPDLISAGALPGIEVFQLTSESGVPGSHIYMEAQVFTPDSRRLLLHRSAYSHSAMPRNPDHRYLLCDLDDHCRLTPLTHEVGATAPSISPDGRYLYYLVDESELNGGRVMLKRVALDGSERETLLVIDAPLPGTAFRPSRIYSLSTISSDGRRLATQAFLGDGVSDNPHYGLLLFNLQEASVSLPLHGSTWLNMHPQYCRSDDPAASHDIMVQEGHNYAVDPTGQISDKPDGKGTDIHVIRDDGTILRSLPWGRDGNEFCQGHQCWRGRSTWAITSTHTREPASRRLIEGLAVPDAGHIGLKTPSGVRNDLVRDCEAPNFYHFAVDRSGNRMISDSAPLAGGSPIYLIDLGEPGKEPLKRLRFLLNPRNDPYRRVPDSVHVHPFLSPDGNFAFFNSNESGISQAYMVRGLSW